MCDAIFSNCLCFHPNRDPAMFKLMRFRVIMMYGSNKKEERSYLHYLLWTSPLEHESLRRPRHEAMTHRSLHRDLRRCRRALRQLCYRRDDDQRMARAHHHRLRHRHRLRQTQKALCVRHCHRHRPRQRRLRRRLLRGRQLRVRCSHSVLKNRSKIDCLLITRNRKKSNIILTALHTITDTNASKQLKGWGWT